MAEMTTEQKLELIVKALDSKRGERRFYRTDQGYG